MTLTELLEARGVRRALIVDDACDPEPRAADLSRQQGEWAIFNDDLEPEQRALIDERSPMTQHLPFDEKILHDSYVAAVWSLRNELGPLAEPLFASYIANTERDLAFVQLARTTLEAHDLVCIERGRDFADAVAEADLILIDLYLGGAQDENAFDVSKRLLGEALDARRGNLPLVILMSRSNRLDQNRDQFRDEVGLLESGFRIIAKQDLERPEKLERRVERLAEHAAETRRLDRFFHALEVGTTQAAARTLALTRRLRLSDIGQIQHLLLDFEGEPTGSYLVDVFDRVLQHEIERDEEVIAAALALTDFPTAQHPPPYVAGSADLQALVERMLTQNPGRLALPGSIHSPVTFGDILRMPAARQHEHRAKVEAWAAQDADQRGPCPLGHPLDIGADDVLLVLTPVCDLLRDATQRAPRILLLVGTCKKMSRGDWVYGPDNRTVAIRIDGEIGWVQWNLKHVDTLSWVQLEAALGAGDLEIFARLREAHALEIQQRVLAGLGRVGLVAALPATFPVNLQAFTCGPDGQLVLLDVPALGDGAVCWVGRDVKGGQVVRLVLTEGVCDGLMEAMAALPTDMIYAESRPAFELARFSQELRHRLETGIDLKGVGDQKWAAISVDRNGQATPAGLIAWNLDPAQPLSPADRRRAGVVLLMHDAQDAGAPGLLDVQRSGGGTEV